MVDPVSIGALIGGLAGVSGGGAAVGASSALGAGALSSAALGAGALGAGALGAMGGKQADAGSLSAPNAPQQQQQPTTAAPKPQSQRPSFFGEEATPSVGQFGQKTLLGQ